MVNTERAAPLFVEQAQQRTGELGCLPALLDVELRENVLEMRLHGFGRDIERPRDLLIRLIESHERQHVAFALRQPIQGVASRFGSAFPMPVSRRHTHGAKAGSR
jgi:hypothetical protein